MLVAVRIVVGGSVTLVRVMGAGLLTADGGVAVAVRVQVARDVSFAGVVRQVSRSFLGLRINEASTGTSVSESRSEPAMANVIVSAIGLNSFALQTGQGEQRQEHDDDDQDGECDWVDDLPRRLQHHVRLIDRPPTRVHAIAA